MIPKTSEELIKAVLDIIGFTENKQVFVDEFLRNVRLQSLLNLVQSLPEDKQETIKQALAKELNNPERIASITKEYFSDEQIQKAVDSSSRIAIEEYLRTIDPTLSTSQRSELKKLFDELNPTAS